MLFSIFPLRHFSFISQGLWGTPHSKPLTTCSSVWRVAEPESQEQHSSGSEVLTAACRPRPPFWELSQVAGSCSATRQRHRRPPPLSYIQGTVNTGVTIRLTYFILEESRKKKKKALSFRQARNGLNNGIFSDIGSILGPHVAGFILKSGSHTHTDHAFIKTCGITFSFNLKWGKLDKIIEQRGQI